MTPTGLKTAFLVLIVIVMAAATIHLAMKVAGDVMPWWMAALGPILLVLVIWSHLRGRSS